MRTYEHAAAVLTGLLQDRGLSAADFSRETGVDAGVLRAILAGRQRAVSTRNMLTFARFFHMSLAEMIDLLS
jgi:predicted transcriptional regulator